MKLFSKGGLLLTTAVLLMGIASANKPDKMAIQHFPDDNKTYTANGTTDLKTAEMLVNLLRNPHLKVQAVAQISAGNEIKLPTNSNDSVYTAHGKTDKKTAMLLVNLLRNPHLQVKAEVHPKVTQNTANTYYSISGKTDIKNIKKLQALLKSNKHIQINVQGNKKPNVNLNAHSNPHMQQYRYIDYSAIISQGRSFYHNGRPPVFIQGSTLWYPVPVQGKTTN